MYGKTLCSNRSLCELFPKDQKFSVVGSSPVTKVNLLMRPTKHRAPRVDQKQIWKLLSHFSMYYVSMMEKNTAKSLLVRILELYNHDNNPIFQRQIESVESIDVSEDVQPIRKNGWKGYYRGTRFVLTLTERRFDGNSIILFAKIIHRFLALFCHINSFVTLELKMANGRSYLCPAMSGHQIII